jgi:uncharacterized protein YciI
MSLAELSGNSAVDCGPTFAWAADTSMASAEKGMDVVYYLLIARGVPGKVPPAGVLAEHGAHLARLDRQGMLALAGPFLDRFGGAIVLRAADQDEARGLAEEAPMVRGGFDTYELIPWKLATQRNHYLPKLEQR